MITRILIVEDEHLLAKKLAHRLVEEGFDVKTEEDGEKGWETALSWRPQLVLLDIQLPSIDGFSLCRRLRAHLELAHMSIIMMTARGMEVDKIVGLEIGADDYLVKPISLGELIARIRAVLRRAPQSPPENELESNGIRIELLSRRVYRDNVEIRMTNKEFELLSALIQNKGKVLSRDLLLTKVWTEDVFIDKRTVDVHIRWVREKIEENPSEPKRITTVRGTGYRYEA